MGTGSGFTKFIRKFFVSLSPELRSKLLYFIDGSYVLYAITRIGGLGYEMFAVEPTDNEAIKAVAGKCIRQMEKFLAPLHLHKENSIWVFEGKIPKKRHSSMAGKQAGILSKGLRLLYRRQKGKGRKFYARRENGAKELISKAYGRPPPWLTAAIARELANSGLTVDYSDSVESDFRICQLAKAFKIGILSMTGQKKSFDSIAVVGSDSDFLALSPPDSVDSLIKIQHGIALCVEKSNLLQELQFDGFQLLLAYCIGGCDNMDSHVEGVGWSKAARFVLSAGISQSSFAVEDEIPLQKGSAEIKKSMAMEIRKVQDNFGWNSVGQANFSGAPIISRPGFSGEKEFSAEIDSEGYLIRPAVYRLVWGVAPVDKIVRPSKPVKKAKTAKGAVAPIYPPERPIPTSNRFFVLANFNQISNNSFDKGLHLPADDRKKWLDDKNNSTKEMSCSQRDTRPKRKKNTNPAKNQNKKPKTNVNVCVQPGVRRSSRKSSKTLNPDQVAETADDNEVVETKLDDKKPSTRKPRKPSKMRNLNLKKAAIVKAGAKARKKASQSARSGLWNPDQGNATLSGADRKYINRSCKVFTIRVGSFKKSVKNAVRHLPTAVSNNLTEIITTQTRKMIEDGHELCVRGQHAFHMLVLEILRLLIENEACADMVLDELFPHLLAVINRLVTDSAKIDESPDQTFRLDEMGKSYSQIAKFAVNYIKHPSISAIDKGNMSGFLTNIAAGIESSFLNQLATLDQLKWSVVNSVQAYEETDIDFLQVNNEKRKKLLERGIANIREIFPSAVDDDQDFSEKITGLLNGAIDDLVGDRPLIREKVLSGLGEKLNEIVSGDADKMAKLTGALDIAIKELLEDRVKRADIALKKLKTAVQAIKNFPQELLKSAASQIVENNKTSLTPAQQLKSFLLTNLLLPRTSRYALTPISGLIPSHYRIPMLALHRYLNKDIRYKTVIENLNRQQSREKSGIFSNASTINQNAVLYQRYFVFNPLQGKGFRSLRHRLKSNSIMVNPSILTDGYQLYVSFAVRPKFAGAKAEANVDKEQESAEMTSDLVNVEDSTSIELIADEAAGEDGIAQIADDVNSGDGVDGVNDANGCDSANIVDAGCHNAQHNSTKKCKKPDGKLLLSEISRYLARNPERAAEIKTIMAADEGTRYPIDVSVIDMASNNFIDENSPGLKRRMRTRKGCLYQWENEQRAKLDCRKAKTPGVLEAEAELGATGTKNSLSLERYRDGYYAAWLKHQRLLFDFYRQPAIRSDRFRCCVRRQQLYDKLVEELFALMGIKQSDGRGIDNRSKLVVLGQQSTSVVHKGHRPSKHAAFWRYFALKASSIGVDTVGLVEYNSSKVCMWCCEHIKHDPKKHHRVYFCDKCQKYAHRDDSSAEIHCAVAWSEVIGVKKALDSKQLPKYDPGDNKSVCYFRPQLFQCSWMRPKMSNNDIQLDPQAKGSAMEIEEGFNNPDISNAIPE